jgi:hypothetical protein
MAGTDQAEQSNDDGVADAKPSCVALVTVNPSAPSQTFSPHSARPSSVFVTHLIATATQAPQTRSLRRASSADAQTAYNTNRQAVKDTGFRTRQII